MNCLYAVICRASKKTSPVQYWAVLFLFIASMEAHGGRRQQLTPEEVIFPPEAKAVVEAFTQIDERERNDFIATYLQKDQGLQSRSYQERLSATRELSDKLEEKHAKSKSTEGAAEYSRFLALLSEGIEFSKKNSLYEAENRLANLLLQSSKVMPDFSRFACSILDELKQSSIIKSMRHSGVRLYKALKKSEEIRTLARQPHTHSQMRPLLEALLKANGFKIVSTTPPPRDANTPQPRGDYYFKVSSPWSDEELELHLTPGEIMSIVPPRTNLQIFVSDMFSKHVRPVPFVLKSAPSLIYPIGPVTLDLSSKASQPEFLGSTASELDIVVSAYIEHAFSHLEFVQKNREELFTKLHNEVLDAPCLKERFQDDPRPENARWGRRSIEAQKPHH